MQKIEKIGENRKYLKMQGIRELAQNCGAGLLMVGACKYQSIKSSGSTHQVPHANFEEKNGFARLGC